MSTAGPPHEKVLQTLNFCLPEEHEKAAEADSWDVRAPLSLDSASIEVSQKKRDDDVVPLELLRMTVFFMRWPWGLQTFLQCSFATKNTH